MIRDIVKWPSNTLRKKAKTVTIFDEKLTQLVIDLHQTMDRQNMRPELPDAAGLAATQIGVFQRVFVYKLGKDASCMINPVILEREGEQYESEGCLSFPGVYIKVKRADKILVEFQDVDGNKNRLKTDGFVSRCIQHEIDHLDGVTYLHALSQVKRDMVTRKMRKAKKQFRQQEKQFNEWKRQQAALQSGRGSTDDGADSRREARVGGREDIGSPAVSSGGADDSQTGLPEGTRES